MTLSPGDFEHVDCLDLDDESTFSISLVRHAENGGLYVEVLHGARWGDRFVYVPVALQVDSFDELATAVGTEAGR
ncbi:hypothetical protein ABGB17_20280 [Sphaerisporangium sp. B11E5]|uniref:hypothetical protein n=1 Tax=Sphaerisporangium sp. B11E5 TaxID=3153563 RepID=UPI00325C43C1